MLCTQDEILSVNTLIFAPFPEPHTYVPHFAGLLGFNIFCLFKVRQNFRAPTLNIFYYSSDSNSFFAGRGITEVPTSSSLPREAASTAAFTAPTSPVRVT